VIKIPEHGFIIIIETTHCLTQKRGNDDDKQEKDSNIESAPHSRARLR